MTGRGCSVSDSNQNSSNLQTLAACYQEIAKMLPRGTTMEAYFQDAGENGKSSLEICLEVGEKLKLAPVHRNDVSCDELASYFGAPLLLQLQNGNWLIFLGLRKLVKNGDNEERFAIFDPLSSTKGNMIFLKREQLEKAWQNSAVFLKIELQGCSVNGEHTTLYAMTAILKHHGADVDVPRFVHDYAISEAEPEERLLCRIADNENFSSKGIKITWDKLPGINKAYPVLGYHKDGTAVVLCGVRQVPAPSGKEQQNENASPVEVNPVEGENDTEPEMIQQLAICQQHKLQSLQIL